MAVNHGQIESCIGATCSDNCCQHGTPLSHEDLPHFRELGLMPQLKNIGVLFSDGDGSHPIWMSGCFEEGRCRLLQVWA